MILWGTSFSGQNSRFFICAVLKRRLDMHRWARCDVGGRGMSNRPIAQAQLTSRNHRAQRELNLSAVVAQCPYLGNSGPMKLSWAFVKTFLNGVVDVLRQAVGLYPKYIPAVAHPGEVGMLSTPGSKQGMLSLAQDTRYVTRVPCRR